MGAQIAPGDMPPSTVSEEFEVMPANWKSVCAFLDCQTQWAAVATFAGVIWLGLDYQAVDVVLRRHDLDNAVFADIQAMERAALDVFAEVAR
ncbi:hypothetical protein AQS8620_01418 [Aquimixticola soesokkakensis]|uniref:DUF1799 domain-containing protein n=1 Tax=Aquimixticola soesokkakensis TaxID=1519096 RepID=A0A1Y5SHZ2_9RHOB|nr:DUF1799 domain-containing protein [Aquimixticola soesokkakensis]SLN38062.1 hypothetical protein AQS8620_01418 [Aquimixticola soesokkakensis]